MGEYYIGVDSNGNYICHFRTKGSKNGIRRAPWYPISAYLDSVRRGTTDLTVKGLGKAALDTHKQRVTYKNSVKRYKKQVKTLEKARKKAAEAREAKKKEMEASEKSEQEKQALIKSGNVKALTDKCYIHKLTDEEFKEAFNQRDRAKKVAAALSEDIDAAKAANWEKADRFFNRVDKFSGYVKSGVNVYNMTANIVNTASGTNKMKTIDINATKNKDGKNKDGGNNTGKDTKNGSYNGSTIVNNYYGPSDTNNTTTKQTTNPFGGDKTAKKVKDAVNNVKDKTVDQLRKEAQKDIKNKERAKKVEGTLKTVIKNVSDAASGDYVVKDGAVYKHGKLAKDIVVGSDKWMDIMTSWHASHDAFDDPNYISHYGVKNQQWGGT